MTSIRKKYIIKKKIMKNLSINQMEVICGGSDASDFVQGVCEGFAVCSFFVCPLFAYGAGVGCVILAHSMD